MPIMDPQEFPDKTVDELEGDDEFEAEKLLEASDDFADSVAEFNDLMNIVGAAVILGRMFEDGKITLREYIRLTNYVEEYEADLDLSII